MKYSLHTLLRHSLAKAVSCVLIAANTFLPSIALAQETIDAAPTPPPTEIAEPAPEPIVPTTETPTDPAPTPEPAAATPTETPLDPAPTLGETDPAAPLPSDTPAEAPADAALAPEGDGSQMAAMSGGGTTPPTIPAPNVLSIQNAQPKVDANTGALTFRIPLDIPPGRNGMQPDVALVYNSQNTQDGIAGYGWELSIPHITRINKTGSQNLYSAGFFSSSLDGELATTSTSTSSPLVYRGRVDESRRTYSFASNTWTVYDTNGTRYLFGSASQSQLAATTSPSTIYRWYLDEIRDTNDNYVRFVYTRDGNQLYPSQILYTGSGSTDGIFTVDFTYASRPDPFIDYRPGFRVTTSNRLTQVTAKMSGSTLRQYMLAYQSGNNGKRSLLQSIQQSGNGDTSTTLPALAFSYAASSLRFVRPAPNVYYPIRGSSWIPTDVDGNGVNDVTVMWQNVTNSTNYTDLFIDPNGATVSVASTPDYWAQNSNEPDPRPAHERGTRFLDIDADGKADIVRGYHTQYPTPASTTAIYLNTYSTTTGTYAWTSTTTGTSNVPPIVSNSNYDITYRTTGVFADLNADGLPDFTQRIDGVYASTSYIGDGHGWIATTTAFAPAKSFPGSSPSPTNSQLADINGDGLADWIYSDNSSTYVLLNYGTGWNTNPDPQWTIATSTLFHSAGSYYDRGFRFLDVNGDGLTDAIHGFYGDGTGPESGSYNDTYINTGSGWATTTQYAVGVTTASTVGGIFRYQYNELANFDGNGQQPQDVISTITYPKGGSTSVTYATSSSMVANRELPYSLLVVTSLVNHDGFGSNEAVTYSYSGGKQYRPYFLADRKFAGFASTTVSTPTTKTTTYYHQHDGVQSSLGEQSDSYALINRPFREDIMTTAGTLLRKTLRKWEAITHGASSFVAATRELVQDFASDGTHRDRAAEYSYSTTTDDLLQVTEYGEVTGNTDGTFTDTVSDGRATTFTYTASSSINLSRPTEKKLLILATTTNQSATAPAQVLVIGGGGGGGRGDNVGGGGGAGGYLYDPAHTVSTGSFTVSVGAGGAGGTVANGYTGLNGATSTFNTMSAVGGGGGNGNSSTGGRNGGSGGGGEGYPNTASYKIGGAGTAGQGNAGGNGKGTSPYGAGGGGGASAAGSNGVTNGGSGGAGIANNISGATTTYAGGGGGGAWVSGGGTGGAGGAGGGGKGADANTNNGTAGSANTGGGGGGASNTNGYDGGSGLVIISYPTGLLTATGGTISTTSTNTIHKFTSSGTFSVTAINATSSGSSYTTVAHSKYYYDTLPFGSVGKGNKTRQEDLKSGSLFASTTIGYNSFGLVTSTTDRNGNRTTYSYDAYNLYPTTVTNPLSQATQYTYNYSNGQVVQTTDPNGRLAKKRYDGVGRVIEVQQSDLSTPATLVSATTFTYTDNSSPPSSVKRSDFLTATTSVDSYTYLDGLGRERQSRVQNNAGSYTATDKTYDSAGRLYQSSLPYFSAGTSYTSPTTTPALLTTYSYDALGRITSQVNSVGTTATTYSTWTQTVTDANSHIKDFIKDAFGNLVQVVEHAAANYTTTYAYDVLGNLASTTDALGNVRSFTYDALSRRTAATDLHAPADATFGSYSYSYDDNGNLISQTDPKSQTITRAYDALNRIMTEDYTGDAGTEVTYTYDSCTYGIGALCTASSTAAKLTQSYDILGRVFAATTTIGGTHYPTSQLFDRHGNITQQNYPSGSRVTYTYGAGGLVSSITRTSAGTTTPIVTAAYQPTTQLSQLVFGNNASTTYSYDSISRLTRILTKGAATTTTYALPVNAKVLVIGGGGGGGNTYYGDGDTGGGGGGGGYQYSSSTPLSVTAYPVTVGAGGAAATDGSSSSFSTITAIGGGRGGGQTSNWNSNWNGGGGGSGGGASYTAGAPGAGTPGQGSNGGTGSVFGAGGGGGIGAVGSNASSYTGGNGGTGFANDITGTTTYYAAGGGGGGVNTRGLGGLGGGGNGGTNSSRPGSPGTNGLGGGGGGATCYYCYSFNYGGAGGSGLVIISYPTGSLTASGGTTTTSGTSTIHTFTTNGTFTVSASNNISTTTEPEKVVDLTYTYDPVGNILSRTDAAYTLNTASQTTTYTYDALDRLLTASTTGSTGTPYVQSFSYDALGSLQSMLTDSTNTTYLYAQTGYANPHAPTSVGGVTHTYDSNGNLTQAGTKTFAWDYANRLIQSTGTATTTYGYDHAGSRVFQTVGSTTTIYPSRFYSITATVNGATTTATSTEYIFLRDRLVATVDQPLVNATATGTPTTSYVHADHLGSTAAVTNASAAPAQRLDYYPYGGARVSSGASTNKRQYIGEFVDGSGLSYLNARYYDSARGQFMGQDPVFWEIGLSRDGKALLANPQALNSYGYGNGNPILNKDPSGRCPMCIAALGGAGAGMVGQYGVDVYNNINTNGLNASAFYSNLSSGETYLTRALQGAVVGIAGGAAGSLSITTQMAITGTASGVTGAAGNAYLGESITFQSVFSDTVIGGLTFGLGGMARKIPGRLPNFGTEAFFLGKHTQQSAAQISYGGISNYLSSIVGTFGPARTTAVQNYNSNPGASSPQSKLWIAPNGAVITWGGIVVAPPATTPAPSSRKRRRKIVNKKDGSEVTIYRPSFAVMGGGLVMLIIVFFGLTLPIMIEGVSSFPEGKLMGLAGLWLISAAATVYPLGFTLEVGSDYVNGYLFGFKISNAHSANIESIERGNIFFGNMGGKGLRYRINTNGKAKTYVVGEIIYGKDAIDHASRVLHGTETATKPLKNTERV